MSFIKNIEKYEKAIKELPQLRCKYCNEVLEEIGELQTCDRMNYYYLQDYKKIEYEWGDDEFDIEDAKTHGYFCGNCRGPIDQEQLKHLKDNYNL